MHIAGDLLFFTLIWPYDAARPLVWTHGADASFWLHTAQVVIFGVLAGLAFRHLRGISATQRDTHNSRLLAGP